jgi:hypothetical protein
MSEPQLPREVRRRLAIIRHAEEVTGNVAMTCRYYGISRQVYYRWLRRYQDQGIDGLLELPGIEPDALPGNMPSELQFRSVSFRFSPARYLRFRSRVLTASRAVATAPT